MNNLPIQTAKQPKFSVAITTKGYQKLINNTLKDPERAKRFIASITSAVAVNPALQECEAGSILAGALLGESLNLSPSPQLGQYYLVPFKSKEKKAHYKELKELSYLLKYDLNPRTKTFNKIKRLSGFRLMMTFLKVLCKVRSK